MYPITRNSFLAFIAVLLSVVYGKSQTRKPWQDIRAIINAIQDTSITNANQLMRAMGCWARDSADLGFGGKRVKCLVTNGPFECWISVVSFNNQVMEYNINSAPDKATYLITKDTCFNHAFLTLENFRDKKSFFFVNKVLYEKYRQKVVSTLGGMMPVDIPDTSMQEYKVLSDPIYGYDYGMSCYSSGIGPMGRDAVDRYQSKVSAAAVRSLICGANPEGRIYAIDMFCTMLGENRITLTDGDKLLIKKVLNLNIDIHTCNGCSGKRQKGKEIFSPWFLALLD